MALSISNIVAASYNAVLTKARKPENQWVENAFMRELEQLGAIEKRSFGPNLEETLDYQMNPDAGFQANDMAAVELSTKTEVLTAALYSIAELSVPMKWSKKDDAMNPSENQKVSFVKNLVTNSLNAHDALIEQALFTASTSGFLGLPTHAPDSGQGTDGGIDAAADAFWRNPALTGASGYAADGSDIDAKMTVLWNQIIKGTGSPYTPKGIISGATPHALFEAGLQAQQRFEDVDKAVRGFKVLMFKTARYSFSQYGGSNLYFWNPEVWRLVVSKEYFRDRGETQEMEARNAFISKIYSALQTVTRNKSRMGVLGVAP